MRIISIQTAPDSLRARFTIQVDDGQTLFSTIVLFLEDYLVEDGSELGTYHRIDLIWLDDEHSTCEATLTLDNKLCD